MFRRLIAVAFVVSCVHVWYAVSFAQNAVSAIGETETSIRDAFASPSGPQLTILEADARSITIEMRAHWDETLSEVVGRSETARELLTNGTRSTWEVSKWVELNGREGARVDVLSADFDEGSFPAGMDRDALEAPLAELVAMGTFRKQFGASLVIRPLRAEGNALRRYRRVVVRVERGQETPGFQQRVVGATNPHLTVARSVLASGQWYRLKVREDGVYRVDRQTLEDLGINPDATDPASLQIYGNGGVPLPAANDAPRPADLLENATRVVGGGDGSFDAGDGLYFYGQGPMTWFWDADSLNPGWRHRLNVFTDHAAYFLRVGGQNHQRVGEVGFPGWSDARALPRIEDRLVVEEDRENWEEVNSGSGLDWLGERIERSGNLTLLDTIPPGFSGGTVRYRTRVGVRSDPAATIAMSAGGQTVHSVSLGINNPNTSTGVAINAQIEEFEVGNLTSPAVSYVMTGGSSNALAWIDFVEAFLERPARARGGVLRFATPGGQAGRFEFSLRGFDQRPQVWDVTDLSSIQPIGVQPDGNNFRIQVEVTDAARPREILAFVPRGGGVRTPTPDGAVENQNLHGISSFPDYVIVSADILLTQAQRLADYRQQNDGLTPLVVRATQVFNEFGNGVSDMRAIRDFMKFLYDRAPDDQLPKWLLLFGDGHYDFRGLEPQGSGPPLLPTYQTDNTFSPLDATYTSDDYFGLLDDDEGTWRWEGNNVESSERVDVGIGRIPANSPDSARAFVDKIFRYESEDVGEAWRSKVVFTADDQFPNSWDSDIHIKNSEDVSADLVVDHPEVTLQKIYEESFPLVTTAEGRRRPGATEALRRSFEEGVLLVNYNGHGGPEGLSGEKLVTREFAANLTNTRYPILLTASCSVGKYDANGWTSLAEDMLMRPEAGNIAVFTTVRVVYTSASAESYIVGINRALVDSLFQRNPNGSPRRLGTATMLAKQTGAGVTGNNRKVNLLGDPAMRIGLPVQSARITSINGVAVPADSASMPVFRAFEVARVEGEVLTSAGQRDPGFNGETTVTVFDSERSVPIPQSAVSHTNGFYNVRTGKLFTGRASVQNGRFGIEFLVPQDVSYSGEDARISTVGKSGNGRRDAIGASLSALIAEDTGTPPNDSEGPAVRLFLGDTTFVSGGLVHPEPAFIAKLSDPSGINTVGAGVGHEMLLEIDGKASEAVDVSPYYRGDLDTYRSGEVRYSLPSLSPGEHTLRFTAWDGVNNATTAELAFVVGESTDLVVQNAYPYPNPTPGATRFVFEHNQAPGTAATAQLRIYTIAGRPVRTFDSEEILPTGAFPGPMVAIPWDGRDDDGDRLATGIYLYKLRVETDGADGERSVSEVVERLAIIR